jgi:23S rRNA (uracil1939-C5)-methyltransferase
LGLTNKTYPIKKRQELELKIEKLAFGGKGIGYIDDYVIFVPKSIPGDLVRVRIVKRKTHYAEARLLDLIEASSLRQEAPCPYFGWCGGCTWQNLDYSEQLRIKKDQVEESIKHIGGLKNVEVLDTIPSEHIWAYRNKMEFSFSDLCWLLPEDLGNDQIKKDFALGLHVPGTFDKILNIDTCLLQSESANKVLQIVRNYSKENHLQPYGIRSHEGYLRFLVIRQSLHTSDIMVNIVTSTDESKLLLPLAKLIMSEVPEVSSVVNNVNSKKAQIAVGETETLLAGNPNIDDRIGDFSFEISANSFFQTNTAQAAKLYQIVMAYAELHGDEVVWDLYAGTGTISLFLAKKAGIVYAFELIDSAVEDGIRNAKKYGINNLKFISGDLLNNLNTVNEKAKLIVVDPPRSGMHPKVCKFLSESDAERIIYVSCNPTTMSRDLEILSDKYSVLKVQPVDMFPHTYHIETVTLLNKKK